MGCTRRLEDEKINSLNYLWKVERMGFGGLSLGWALSNFRTA